MKITVNFSSDSHTLFGREQKRLNAFLQNIDWEMETAVQISGYTDNHGTDDYNQALSRQRAESVKQHLSKNVSALPAEVNTTGFGNCCYLSTNITPQSRARNRRVTLVIQTLQTTPESH